MDYAKTMRAVGQVPSVVWIAGGLALAVVALSIRKQKPVPETVAEITGDVATFIGDAAGGVFQGLASVVGVPTTGEQKCCAAVAEYSAAAGAIDRIGAAFKVSAHCPAVDYVKWAAGKGGPAYCATKAQPETQKRTGATGTW
jgi:hypothetical protein